MEGVMVGKLKKAYPERFPRGTIDTLLAKMTSGSDAQEHGLVTDVSAAILEQQHHFRQASRAASTETGLADKTDVAENGTVQ